MARRPNLQTSVPSSQSRSFFPFFGALVKPSLATIKDLTFRECLTLMPLVALTILFGFYPKPVLDISASSVQQLVNNYNTAMTTAVKAAALLQ